MLYREANPLDLATLAAMNERLIRDEGHRNRMSLPELEQRLGQWLGADYRAFVFEAEGRPWGYALFREEPEHVYLRQFFVAEPYRRRGGGRAALAWLGEHVWRGRRLRVEVLTGNAAAIAFWRSVGFAEYSLTLEKASSAG